MRDKALFFVSIREELQPMHRNNALLLNETYTTFEFYVEVNGVKFIMTGDNYTIRLEDWDETFFSKDVHKVVVIEREET